MVIVTKLMVLPGEGALEARSEEKWDRFHNNVENVILGEMSDDEVAEKPDEKSKSLILNGNESRAEELPEHFGCCKSNVVSSGYSEDRRFFVISSLKDNREPGEDTLKHDQRFIEFANQHSHGLYFLRVAEAPDEIRDIFPLAVMAFEYIACKELLEESND